MSSRPCTASSSRIVTALRVMRGSKNKMARSIRFLISVITLVLSVSNTCALMPQPYAGCMMRSPGVVESRMVRLSRISSSPPDMSTRPPPPIAGGSLLKTGGNAQPLPRKDLSIDMRCSSAADHHGRKTHDDGAAVAAGVAHAHRRLLADHDGGRAL